MRGARLVADVDAEHAAGVVLHAHLGDVIVAGAPLATIHAEAPGQLDYALDYARANADMFEIEA